MSHLWRGLAGRTTLRLPLWSLVQSFGDAIALPPCPTMKFNIHDWPLSVMTAVIHQNDNFHSMVVTMATYNKAKTTNQLPRCVTVFMCIRINVRSDTKSPAMFHLNDKSLKTDKQPFKSSLISDDTESNTSRDAGGRHERT